MTPAELTIWTQKIEADLERQEEELKHVKNKILPDIYEKLSSTSAKITALIMLWSANMSVLLFLLYKVFEVGGKINGR